MSHKIYDMSFSKVYPMLVAKSERKDRSRAEVDQVTTWLTGYSSTAIEEALSSEVSYGDFFRQAPALNPKRHLITGSICGVKLTEIKEPLMQDIRYLDKLVDELAKGSPMEKVIRS